MAPKSKKAEKPAVVESDELKKEESEQDMTPPKKTEPMAPARGGRPTRQAALKKSVEPAESEHEDEDETEEYEADDDEEVEVKKKARGKRGYEEDEDYGKAKKTKKAKTVAKKTGKKAAKAQPTRATSRKTTQPKKYATSDDEVVGKATSESDSDDGTKKAPVTKRPPNGRMSGAPPSSRIGAPKRGRSPVVLEESE